jgi:hypothetical protein
MPTYSDLAGVTGDFSISGKLTTDGVLLRAIAISSTSNLTAINSDDGDFFTITLSEDTTFQNPTGTPTNGQLLQIRITSSASRAISFGTAYQAASSLSLPTATTGGGAEDYIAFRYNSTDSEWDLIGTTIGALPTGLKTAVATVNFTTASKGQFFSVSVAGALAGDRVVATPSLIMPSGVDEDELECDPIYAYGSCTTNGTVRLFVGSVLGGLIGGQRNINLLLG